MINAYSLPLLSKPTCWSEFLNTLGSEVFDGSLFAEVVYETKHVALFPVVSGLHILNDFLWEKGIYKKGEKKDVYREKAISYFVSLNLILQDLLLCFGYVVKLIKCTLQGL